MGRSIPGREDAERRRRRHLEVFDEAGEMIVQFFGKRKPGIPEREDWRTLVAETQERLA